MTKPIKTIDVTPNIPEKLKPLQVLSNNLWFTWNHEVEELFRRMNPDLWDETNKNPVAFLGRLPQPDLDINTDINIIAPTPLAELIGIDIIVFIQVFGFPLFVKLAAPSSAARSFLGALGAAGWSVVIITERDGSVGLFRRS